MSLIITTNVASINAQRTLSQSNRALTKSYAQLSSGSRITKAADDAAGLSMSEGFKATIRGYKQAQRNANDGISMIQVAEGGIAEISNILTRIRELGVQAASDTIGDIERGFVDREVQQLKLEVQRIAESTRYNGRDLLTGEGEEYSFQVDVNNDDFRDRIAFDSSESVATLDHLELGSLEFASRDGAREALSTIDSAQKTVNGYRANLGALQNRLISTGENLSSAIENFSAANARIRDTDIAESSAELARNNVLSQASVSMLAQANQQPNMALRLIS
ncbi:MAG: flagellin FliC [Bdellovibrionaceae bacterium]|nr:flagellin FliC [Pseudobdellovibrionaceae bacterium]|tara:strand:+ start:70872 stop:71705 length:834 start_codon:yes stop_codon:yes gene_type:complete